LNLWMETFFILIIGAVAFISIVLLYLIAQQQKNIKVTQPNTTQIQQKTKTKQKIVKENVPTTTLSEISTPAQSAPTPQTPNPKEIEHKHVNVQQKKSHAQPKPTKNKTKEIDPNEDILVLAKKHPKAHKIVEEPKEEEKNTTVQEEEWKNAKKAQKVELDHLRKKLSDKDTELTAALKQIEIYKKNITELKTQVIKAEKRRAETESFFNAEIQHLKDQQKEHIIDVHQVSHKPIARVTNPWGASLITNIQTTRKATMDTREDLDNRLAHYEKRRNEFLQKKS